MRSSLTTGERHKEQACDRRLGDQHAIEWIEMVDGNAATSSTCAIVGGQGREAGRFDRSRRSPG
jgi:hypothetical protein